MTRKCFILFLLLLLISSSLMATSYTWSGTSTDWNTASNWTPAGVPAAADAATVNACTTCPVLAGNTTVTSLVVNQNGSIGIGSYTLQTTRIYIKQATIQSNGGMLKTPYIDWFSSNHIYGAFTLFFDRQGLGITGSAAIPGGNTFHGPCVIKCFMEWWGLNIDANTYQQQVVFNNIGSGWMKPAWAGSHRFTKKVEFKNEADGRMDIAHSGTAVFEDEVIFNNYSRNYIRVAVEVNTSATFLGPVVVNNLSASSNDNNITFGIKGLCTFHRTITLNQQVTHALMSINFGYGSSTEGRVVMKESASMQIGATGVTSGRISLRNLTQENTSPSVLPTNANLLTIGPHVVFAGAVELKAVNVNLNGATFQGAATIEKTGANPYSTANNAGGNVFNGATTIKNTGGQPWYFGQNAKDLFNADLTLIHSGGNGTYLSHWQTGHEFNGHVQVNLTANATGSIEFGAGGGTSRLQEAKTITVGTFASGELKLFGLTQTGTTAQNLTLTGSAGLTLGAGCVFTAPLTVSAGHLYLNGSSFLSPIRLTKTASGNNSSNGGNTFKGKVYMVNQATSGTLNLATQSNDVFN